MGKIDDIKQAMQALSADELKALREWLDELDERQFDERLERDDRAGKLDQLANRAMDNLKAGRIRDL